MMDEKLDENNENLQQFAPAVETKKPIIIERILEGHCRLLGAIYRDKTPQERMLALLRRVYQRERDLGLSFDNFTEDFQTPELKKALSAFKERQKK